MPKNKEKIKIDTLIISDIHLGGFGVRSEALLKVLRQYEYKKLILNGDILNGLKFNRLNTAHWDVLSKFRKLTATCKVVWIHGNHDARPSVLTKLLGINVHNNYYLWKENNKKYLALHGHQFDKFLINNYILSHLIYGVYNIIKRVDKKSRFTKYLKNNNRTWKRSSIEVAKKAIQFAQVMNVDCVFCGHTHKILHKEKKDLHYYNGGSWNESPSGYITIKDNKIELHHID
jgi:UDP-2,3-diacylglucosamine pyrophosphatase LpxH